MKQINLLCYSHEEFNDIMREHEWYDKPGDGVATISICSPNDDDPYHWFRQSDENLNLEFDDMDPDIYWGDKYNYDLIFDQYESGNVDDEAFYFSNVSNAPTLELHAMNTDDARKLVLFIGKQLRLGIETIYVHCSAGISRSQGVVRYILDTYGDEYEFITNPNNPCLTPNYHVVRMLKRMNRTLFRYPINSKEK